MKKARLIRFVLLILLASLIFLSASAVLIFHYFPKEKILTLITSGAEKILKRKLLIRELDYGLQGIILKDISIYNGLYPDDKAEKSDLFASVKNADIRFSFLPLLKKEFIINHIVLNNFKIIISYNKGESTLGNFLHDLKANEGSDIKAKVSSIRFRDAEITLNDPPEMLKPLEGRYSFNGMVHIAADNRVEITGCRIVLPGDRGSIQADSIGISKDKDNFEVTGSYRLQNCSLLWVYEWNKELSLPFTNFTGKVDNLRITKESIEGYAKGKSKLRSADTADADGKCVVDLKKETVSLLNIKGGLGKSKFFINEIKLTYSDKIKETLLKFNITDTEADINDLKNILTFLPYKALSNIFGEVSGNLSYENNLFNGYLALKNFSYRRAGKDVLKFNSDIPIKNNIVYKEKIPVFVFGQPCEISISTSGNEFQKIVLNLYSKEFNYALNKEDITEDFFSSPKIEQDIGGRIELDNFNIDKFTFSNVAVNYSLSGNRLELNHVSTKFMGGNIKGSGSVDLSGDSPGVKMSTAFEEIKVQNLTGLNKELAGRFFGIAKGNSEVEFSINGDIYNSLKGKMEFSIDKGKLVNTGIQKGLGILLSELKYKLKDLEFNKIYGNFNITGRNFDINSLVFSAPDIRLKIDGYFSRPTVLSEETKIPGDIKIILEYSDFFIQDIPNLPQAQFLKVPGLTLKKKSGWYTMSFRDRGDDITESKNIKPL